MAFGINGLNLSSLFSTLFKSSTDEASNKITAKFHNHTEHPTPGLLQSKQAGRHFQHQLLKKFGVHPEPQQASKPRVQKPVIPTNAGGGTNGAFLRVFQKKVERQKTVSGNSVDTSQILKTVAVPLEDRTLKPDLPDSGKTTQTSAAKSDPAVAKTEDPVMARLRELYEDHLKKEGYSDDAMRAAKMEYKDELAKLPADQKIELTDKEIKQKLKEISKENGAVPTQNPNDFERTAQGDDFFGRVEGLSYGQTMEKLFDENGKPAQLSEDQVQELRNLYQKHINSDDDIDIEDVKAEAKREFREKHTDAGVRAINSALAAISKENNPADELTGQAGNPERSISPSARKPILASQDSLDDPFKPLSDDKMNDLRAMYTKALSRYDNNAERARMEVEVEFADKYADVRLFTLDAALDKLQGKSPRPAPRVRFKTLEELTRPLSANEMEDLSKMYRKAMFAYGDDPNRAKMEAEVWFSDAHPNVSVISLENAFKEMQKK
jgi:hypothetical protein